MQEVRGFSKLDKTQKIELLSEHVFSNKASIKELIESFWHPNAESQRIFDEFSENTLTNFYFPYGVVPSLPLNGVNYCVPMVIEESSVVAAAARSAKFWQARGGFKAEVVNTEKIGQVHLSWNGRPQKLNSFFNAQKETLLKEMTPITSNMTARGGGLKDIKLIDRTNDEPDYYQIWATFETCDAMGANFINTVLEALGRSFQSMVANEPSFDEQEKQLEIIMAILSNYTPDCLVRAWVECPIEELNDKSFGMSAEDFARKFATAVKIAKLDKYRATTHNKGIFNGIDAVVLATGNDFRAVEACGHTYASRDGQYRSLSDVSLENGIFKFSLEIPMALGTVGGLTSLHPLAKLSLEMLNNPSASELMMITAAIGLAQNFGALRSLVTSGIQQGHMKMHLMNILNHLQASDIERDECVEYFKDKTVSFSAVGEFINTMRVKQ